MSVEIWLAFVVASSVLTIIPGPCVLLVVSQALTKGMSAAVKCIMGDILGGVALMLLSLMGVGVILAASATLFSIFKWLGVIYMAYLGYCQIVEAKNSKTEQSEQRLTSSSMGSFKAGFFASLLNPKAIIFYMAFLPQFMNPENSAFLQFSILIVTSSAVVGVILFGYALVAARARKAFQSARSQRYFGYSGGSFLLGSSLFMASTTR
ncbi:LysE family translocator [Aliivibrio kagoshimensis]|uniref:LysE family translocator n=1 Tax=Aliivibrio kagoshimensis TaxID=2910230 RepID=UPI003D12ABE7